MHTIAHQKSSLLSTLEPVYGVTVWVSGNTCGWSKNWHGQKGVRSQSHSALTTVAPNKINTTILTAIFPRKWHRFFRSPMNLGRTIPTKSLTYQTISSLSKKTILTYIWSNPIDNYCALILYRRLDCGQVFGVADVQVLRNLVPDVNNWSWIQQWPYLVATM
jgi:hypothetical protein